MDVEMLKRPVNVGFSGGEKKRAEMVQMGIMRPKFVRQMSRPERVWVPRCPGGETLKALAGVESDVVCVPDRGGVRVARGNRDPTTYGNWFPGKREWLPGRGPASRPRR